jgi:hypothetical protein
MSLFLGTFRTSLEDGTRRTTSIRRRSTALRR